MILTVCMSPSVDVTIEVDSLNVGRLNVVKNKRLSFTGKALNVAIGVARLGEEAFTTGFMYRDNCETFERELEKEGVPFSFLYNEGRVRENYKVIDQKSMLTEFNDVGAKVSKEKLSELKEIVRARSKDAAVTVISGGLPRGVAPDYYREIFGAVDSRSLRITDAEGAKLLSALSAGVDLVKPNLTELQETLGREFHDKEEMLSGCRELISRGAKTVLLSLGKHGAVITNGRKHYYCKSMNVAVNSTLGAGDGMVAAAATVMQRGGDMPDILRAGVAAGTATVTTFGTVSFKKEKYQEIFENLRVTEFL